MNSKIGDTFQQETKYIRGKLGSGELDWTHRPEPYKTYPQAPRVRLDSPKLKGGASVWSILKQRRSVRSFRSEPMTKAELSRVLWAAQGITQGTRDLAFRTAPSAGASYPVETYIAVHRVENLDSVIYHYAVADHALEQLKVGDFRTQIARAALDQRTAYDANVVLIWTAVFERAKWKYQQRAYRYVYLDAGHIAQNVALAAVALGLGTCQIAALYDEEANDLLGVDGEKESVIYMTAVGRKA